MKTASFPPAADSFLPVTNTENTKACSLAAAGVLLVKEDAAVYLVFFALFLFFSEKERRRALWLAGMGIGYFLLAILWLQWQGEGPCSAATTT